MITGTETIVNPLQKSALNKKSLCDYVVNIASGCLHGCTFCYVPSTPSIRTQQKKLHKKGVDNPQLDWGKYLFIREAIPEKLEKVLTRKRKWENTPSGKGVVLLCSGTDPYQNKQIAEITRQTIKVLLKHNKKIRILTRGLLWQKDLDILVNPNITLGMSIPCINDELLKKIEPQAPLSSDRYKALQKAYQANCRLYVAMAPTPPMMTLDDFRFNLDKFMQINPELIFWEPINARGSNGQRMVAAGLDFAQSVMTKKSWGETFIRQWEFIETAATELECLDKIHIWPDPSLKGFVNEEKINHWLYKPTIEKWN
ncbi:radical SAM protein [Microcoleus vaginatus]|uniref:radical SAM protein n=1 Tax=Microcoleus vaginatus TaxID=119532 RepID=UPI001682DB5D|nr:radical SAM protein [Microcoleus sp. FACHB-84]MBD2008947.1 radical SAM protein [Microcoleus sp. FACHB-45]